MLRETIRSLNVARSRISTRGPATNPSDRIRSASATSSKMSASRPSSGSPVVTGGSRVVDVVVVDVVDEVVARGSVVIVETASDPVVVAGSSSPVHDDATSAIVTATRARRIAEVRREADINGGQANARCRQPDRPHRSAGTVGMLVGPPGRGTWLTGSF